MVFAFCILRPTLIMTRNPHRPGPAKIARRPLAASSATRSDSGTLSAVGLVRFREIGEARRRRQRTYRSRREPARAQLRPELLHIGRRAMPVHRSAATTTTATVNNARALLRGLVEHPHRELVAQVPDDEVTHHSRGGDRDLGLYVFKFTGTS